MSYAKVILIGNLGHDPKLRYTPEGKPVCNFSIATNEKRPGHDDITTWFRITAWGPQALNAEKYLAKGRKVYVEGRFRQEFYEARDGTTRHTLEVWATEIQFLDFGDTPAQPQTAQRQLEPTHSGPAAQRDDDDMDDVPF